MLWFEYTTTWALEKGVIAPELFSALCRCRYRAVVQVHGEDGGTGAGWQIASDRMDMIGMTKND